MELLYAPWKPLCCRTHQSLQWDFWLLGKTGTSPGLPQYGQWMYTRTEGHHCSSTQKQTGTCATPWSPHQPSWKVHWYFQVSSYFWTKRHGPKFPFAPLVPHSAAVPRYPKHDAHFPPPPSYVILHTYERTIQLKRHTRSATGDKKNSLRKIAAAQNLGSAWCWCLVYWVLPRPLPLPQDIRPGNPGWLIFPHCFLFPAWFCSPSKKSSGWHSSLNLGPNNCAPTTLPAHSSTTCWGKKVYGHTSTGKHFLPRYSTSNNPSAYPSKSGTPRNCSSFTTNTTIHLSWPLSSITGTTWKQLRRT